MKVQNTSLPWQLSPPPPTAELVVDIFPLSFPAGIAVPCSVAPTTASTLVEPTPPAMVGATDHAPLDWSADPNISCSDPAGSLDHILAALSQQAVLVIQWEAATSKQLDHLEAEFRVRKQGRSLSPADTPDENLDHSFSCQCPWLCFLPPAERDDTAQMWL